MSIEIKVEKQWYNFLEQLSVDILRTPDLNEEAVLKGTFWTVCNGQETQ